MKLSVSFRKVKEYKKYRDLFDVYAIECRVSFIVAASMAALLTFLSFKITSDNFTVLLTELVKDMAMAFIGLLGFSVSGLAILTGAISKRIVDVVLKAGKLKNLENILLSFYLQALVVATTIVCFIGVYIVLFIEKPYIWQLVLLITFVLGYLSVFSIFYSVKLVGNCIDIFEIVNSVGEALNTAEQNVNIRREYESFKLRALENVVLKNNPGIISEYQELISKQIKESCFNEETKEKLWYNYKQHFSIEEKQG